MRHPIITEDLAEISGDSLPFELLSGKTILITGAAGFLAAYLVETLFYLNEVRRAGIRVLALVRNQEKALRRFSHYVGRPDFRLVVQDVANPLFVDGPVEFIIHAASQASPKYYAADPVGTLAPNVLGTFRLLELAREKGAESFLFLSSAEVYGVVDPHLIPIQENSFGFVDPMQVRSCYGESKRMGETICVSFAQQFGVPAKVVRPFHTYGPGMSLDDGRVFCDFVADVVAQRDITMKSEGTEVRAYCYVADATRGFLSILLQGEVATAYNLGNAEATVSVIELAEKLVAIFPERKLRVVKKVHSAADTYLRSPVSRIVPDLSRLRALGWEPRHSIESGFKRTVESYS